MALKLLSAFRNRLQPSYTSSAQLLVERRTLATKAKAKSKEEKCPNESCHKKKRSIWNIFKKKPPAEKPPLETCKKYLAKRRWDPDPDLSDFGGKAYRTCGLGTYIIQKDQIPPQTFREEPEDKILEKLEKHPDLKDVQDPMPPFESVERRLIDLSEKKLHPLYKRYLSMPKKKTTLTYPKYTYKSRSGPIAAEDIPSHLKIDKKCLEQKNLFSEFKRVEPPRQLLAKMIEIKQNERPCMGQKKEQPQQVNINQAINVKK